MSLMKNCYLFLQTKPDPSLIEASLLPMISWLGNFKAIGRSKNFDNMMKKHAMACTLCKNWAFQQNLLSPAKKLPSKRSDLQSKITTNTTSRKTAKKSGLACWKTWVKILHCLKTLYENCKSEILFWKCMVGIAERFFKIKIS